MAQRYGGKYSPNPQATPTNPDNQPVIVADPADGGVGLKANLLFVLPFIFFAKAFRGDASALFIGLGTGGLLLLAAWLTREGIKAQTAYDARRVARRPAIPRKLFAACLTGAALMMATMDWQASFVFPYLFGLLGAGLHLGAFGMDPTRGKGMEGVDQFQTDRVAKAVDEGEKYLSAMKDAILRARDPLLEARVDRFATVARSLFRTVEGDPGDLTAARKYLSVYLMGARDATVKFADVYAGNKSPAVRADYEALLGDLETNFASRTKALLSDDHTDLDVEIQVLRDRLKLEG
ncbi:MAG: 5-bromo-4-chloroindolyl phosphate hydrolysis family protein [bacterium]